MNKTYRFNLINHRGRATLVQAQPIEDATYEYTMPRILNDNERFRALISEDGALISVASRRDLRRVIDAISRTGLDLDELMNVHDVLIYAP